MARPRPELPPAAALRALADGAGRLAVRVTPGARSDSIGIAGGAVQVKVRARAHDGAANEAVIVLLSQALCVAPSRLEMLRGATSRDKLFRLPPG